MKRIYPFNTVGWNDKEKIGFPVGKRKISPAFERTGSVQNITWRAECSFHRPTFIRPGPFPPQSAPQVTPVFSHLPKHVLNYSDWVRANLRSGVIFFASLLPWLEREKNNAWYIYLTSHQPPPNLHNLTSAWPVMLLANQRLPEGNKILAGIIMSLSIGNKV